MRMRGLISADRWTRCCRWHPASGTKARPRCRAATSSPATACGCTTWRPGRATGHTIVFVPGWTMPAWIWGPQIRRSRQQYHVVAFDPRGQGDSDAPASGYEPAATRPGYRRVDRQPGARAGRCWWAGRSACSTRSPMCAGMAIRRLRAWCWWTIRSARNRPRHRGRSTVAPVLPHAIAMHRFVQGMFRRRQSDGLSGPANPGDAAHARIREPRAAILPGAAHLLARRGVFHQQAGALRGAAWLAGGAGGEPGAPPARHADRGVRRCRPCTVRR